MSAGSNTPKRLGRTQFTGYLQLEDGLMKPKSTGFFCDSLELDQVGTKA